MANQSNKNTLVTVSIILFLELIFFLIYQFFCNIEYVSREELIELEKQRISLSEKYDPKKVFFGHIDFSVDLIQKIVDEKFTYQGRRIIVIADKEYWIWAKSASKEIYLEILRRIQSE